MVLELPRMSACGQQGKRGYAPEVHGVASSSARVVGQTLVKLFGETHVPPARSI